MPSEQNIFVAGMARLHLANPGTQAPAAPDDPLPAGWRDVGLFQPGSLGWSAEPKFEEVKSHQLRYTARTIQTEDTASLKVVLQEWSGTNLIATYGGGEVKPVKVGEGEAAKTFYRFTPPKVGARAQASAVVELIDGPVFYRRIIPLVEQVAAVNQEFPKAAESTLPLELKVVGGAAGDPWYDLTNAPSFAPV